MDYLLFYSINLNELKRRTQAFLGELKLLLVMLNV